MVRSSRPDPATPILHVDMDAFFVAVELLRAPELVGRPVVVGGTGERGVVAAASYEARAFGVHSAMPSVRARRLCPDAVFLPGRHGDYAAVSRRIMAVLRSYTPLVEPLSLDEAFLDVGSTARLHGPPVEVAWAIRDRLRAEEGLGASVGVARTKTLAKLASEAAKPRPGVHGPRPGPGVVVVEPAAELRFLHPLPVRALWGVGPATHQRLARLGVERVGELAALDRDTVTSALGAAGGQLHDLAWGHDDRPVVPDQQPRSISHEETFPHDLYDRARLRDEVVRLAESVSARLRESELAGRTVGLKVRYGSFRTVTRSTTLDEPVDTGPAVAREAKALLDELDPAEGVRLLGVVVTGLARRAPRQLRLALDGDDDGGRWQQASEAVDDIRARFGTDAIAPATVAGGRRHGVDRGAANPWGPDGDGGTDTSRPRPSGGSVEPGPDDRSST